MNTERKRKIAEVFFLSCIVVIFFFALFFDIFGLKWCTILRAQHELFDDLFSVQATVVTLSIAIVALISGLATKTYYGISVTKYISTLKPVIFKHRFVIIASILLTLVNYFLVAYRINNLSVWIFFISVMSSAYLTYDIYFIFMGKDKLKNEIFRYYVKHYQKLGLDYLHKALVENQDVSNKMFFSEDMELLKNIYFEMIHHDALLETADKLMLDIINVLIEAKDSAKISDYIEMLFQIYLNANQSEKIIHLELWDTVSYKIFSALRLFDITQAESLLLLHNELFKNQQIIVQEKDSLGNKDRKLRIVNGYDLDCYGAQLIYAVKANQKDINQKSYYRFLEDVILVISFSIRQGENKQKNEVELFRHELKISELCKAYKALIEAHESKTLKESVFCNTYYDVEGVNVSVLVALIFMYYLKIENLTDEGTKSFVDFAIDQNKGKIYNFISKMDVQLLKDYFGFICDTMRMWELMPEEGAKTIVIDSAIRDFIVYMSAYGYRLKSELGEVIRLLFRGGTYSAYLRYSSDKNDDIEGRLKDYYKAFHLYTENNEINEIIDTINVAVSQACKEEEIANRTKNKITTKNQDAFIEKVHNSLREFFGENDFLFDINGTSENEGGKKIGVLKTKLLAGLSNETDYYSESLDNHVRLSVIEIVINEIQGHIKKISLKSSNREKQSALIALKEQEDINCDTVIGGRDVFWEEKENTMLSDYCKEYHHLSNRNGYNRIYLIDSTKVHIKIFDINVDIQNLDDSIIEKRSNTSAKGVKTYQSVNGLYLPFSKAEYTDYINKVEKDVFITAKICVSIDDKIIGVGLEII